MQGKGIWEWRQLWAQLERAVETVLKCTAQAFPMVIPSFFPLTVSAFEAQTSASSSDLQLHQWQDATLKSRACRTTLVKDRNCWNRQTLMKILHGLPCRPGAHAHTHTNNSGVNLRNWAKPFYFYRLTFNTFILETWSSLNSILSQPAWQTLESFLYQ